MNGDPQTEDFRLAEADVRAVVRLLGDTAAIVDSNQQRSFLMRSLARLLGTDTWVWGVSPLLEPGRQPVYIYHQTGGFDEVRMARFLQAVEHPDCGEMTAPLARAMIEAGGQVTRLIDQIISKERFLNSPANPLWRAANIGPILISIRPVPDYGTSVIGFYRALGQPDFSRRESRIAHIVLTEVPWLHQAGLPHEVARPAPALPPRCRLMLNHVVRGRGRKEIAEDLDLSVETVNGYLKQIYRHFGVHSQAELIARFVRGDGGDG